MHQSLCTGPAQPWRHPEASSTESQCFERQPFCHAHGSKQGQHRMQSKSYDACCDLIFQTKAWPSAPLALPSGPIAIQTSCASNAPSICTRPAQPWSQPEAVSERNCCFGTRPYCYAHGSKQEHHRKLSISYEACCDLGFQTKAWPSASLALPSGPTATRTSPASNAPSICTRPAQPR